MSVAKINPFHIKMLTFTLRCYITHESLIEVGGRGAVGGGVCPRPRMSPSHLQAKVMGSWWSLSSGNLWTEKLYTIPQKFEILCRRVSHPDRFSPRSSKSLNESKKKKKSWNRIFKRGSIFILQWFPSLRHVGRFLPQSSTNRHQGILTFTKGSLFKR